MKKQFSNLAANGKLVKKGVTVEFPFTCVRSRVVKVSRGQFWTEHSAPYPSRSAPSDVVVVK
ncbi:MAG: hypothetical protein RL211_2266 [Pseudomonadota bacterium]|jgi:hypothetical protein